MVFQDTIGNLRRQAGGGLRLAVSAPQDALGLAREAGMEGTMQEGRLLFAGMSDRDAARLVRLLVEGGHDVYRVEEERKSLEDIFLSMVEEDAS
jgi:ABC-2 type transport system ATP-binding protein